ncbi:MAG: hypothetical protein F4Y38_06665 [Gemmatimonadetes bacterium]|nr:hypothetical protein [Gemmatimonadota bacterium]MYG84441.1 hypothetical protein [Gemmatimonadota bacterium]MYJ88662.1 hypothetical protein [Gemmatimonadota bacterium]
MRISDVRVRQVAVPRIYDTYCADPKQLKATIDHGRSTYQIIELTTSDGLTGIGEVSDIAPRMDAPSPATLQDLLSGVLVDTGVPGGAGVSAGVLVDAGVLAGGDVRAWRNLYDGVDEALPGDWYPELRQLMLFGVECALLDLVGKTHGLPLYELLGGRCRRAASVSWVAYLRGDATLEDELQALEREVADQVGSGMKAFKLKVGEDHERDLERVRLARKIAGTVAYIKVDASGFWEEDEALSRLRDMAEAGADACETPIRALSRPMSREDPARIEADAEGIAEALAKVRNRSPIPIIEHVADLGDAFLTALIRHRAVDIVNVVPCQAGGLRRASRLLHAAETAGMPALLGSTIELGPGTAASVHLAVSSTNVEVPSDLVGPGLLQDDVCANPFTVEGGELAPIEGPGLGMVLDEEKMERWSG